MHNFSFGLKIQGQDQGGGLEGDEKAALLSCSWVGTGGTC